MKEKTMENEIIQFIGVNELEDADQAVVNKLSTEYYEKIKRSLNNLTSMTVHIKTYKDEGGNRLKYSMHTKVIAPTHIFDSEKTSDWDLARALHKTFKDLESQIEHKLHVSDQKEKGHAGKTQSIRQKPL